VSEQADLKRRIKGVIVDRMNLKLNPEDVKDDDMHIFANVDSIAAFLEAKLTPVVA